MPDPINEGEDTGHPELPPKAIPEGVSGISREEAERRLQAAARIFATGAIRAAIAARRGGNADPAP
jgi:hypothetical protein